MCGIVSSAACSRLHAPSLGDIRHRPREVSMCMPLGLALVQLRWLE